MTDEQRQELIRLLQQGEDIAPEWARILFPPEKREYELVYHGKEREEEILADTLAVPLQPVRTFGKNGEGWHNMLVFGDNLQVMKSLLALKKAGQLCNTDGTSGVRVIYIDPPFATRQEFSGAQDQKAYQDKIAGSQFVEFLRRRLVLLRELLSYNGAIYVHLDQRKSHAMKLVLDEVFGEHGFVNELVWRRISAHNDADKYGPIHDTIFLGDVPLDTRRLLCYCESTKRKGTTPCRSTPPETLTGTSPTMMPVLRGCSMPAGPKVSTARTVTA